MTARYRSPLSSTLSDIPRRRTLASSAFILLFAFVFVWAGREFTRFAWNRVSELADLPLWMIHVAWPVTGLTWFVFQSERMWDAAMVLAGRAQPKPEAKHLEAAE